MFISSINMQFGFRVILFHTIKRENNIHINTELKVMFTKMQVSYNKGYGLQESVATKVASTFELALIVLTFLRIDKA